MIDPRCPKCIEFGRMGRIWMNAMNLDQLDEWDAMNDGPYTGWVLFLHVPQISPIWASGMNRDKWDAINDGPYTVWMLSLETLGMTHVGLFTRLKS